MTLTNLFTIGLLIIVLWQIVQVRHHQTILSSILDNIDNVLDNLSDIIEHSGKKDAETIKALNEICNAFNILCKTSHLFMNHTTFSLQTLAICMIPIIDDIKMEAIRQDNFERANECKKLIEELKRINEINYDTNRK